MLPRRVLALATVTGAAAVSHVPRAHADVSSWMYAGGGASSVSADGGSAETRPLMQLDAGFGSAPDARVVFGGILRTLTHFEGGTDLALCQRTASGGFARGDWGVALDIGGYQRFWGPDSSGGLATLWAGAPWGFQVGVSGALGTNEGQMIGLTIGLDWARATAHRQAGQQWWKNYVLPLSAER